MTNKLTVITGPPGTGKSQVLVNVVSAAVAKGESVLFASKNNKAVDVVFERIQEITPSAQLLRAGAASYRQELAATIKSAISPLPGRSNPLVSLSRQRSIAAEVNEVFGQLKKRLELEVEVKELRKKAKKCADELSIGARIDCDVNGLRHHTQGLKDSLQSFAQKLPFFRRRKRWAVHQERLVKANQMASHLNEFLVKNNLDPFDTDSALQIVSNKPKRSLSPMNTVGDIERCVEILSLVQLTLSEANELEEKIERDFQTWTIEDDLAMLATRRLKVGRALLKMKWQHLLAENTESVAAAQLYVSELTSGSIRAAKDRVQSILPSFPAWGVTNLSTGTNFSLNKEMFDLVVIDEASQCDVASAIPLFFRAKRVLVIGDQRQLTHITNLGKNREKLFARRWKLLDAQEQTSKEHAMFNFKSQSLFSLSELRTGQPLLLNLHFRSQPAIISFSNHQFYDRRLEICTPRYVSLGGEVASSIRWKDVKGRTVRGPSGRSWRNTEEAEEVVRELFELLSRGGTHQSIGVVTPFRPQCDEIRRIAQRDLPQSFSDVTIETVYKFQGDERDVMLFSPVVAEGMEPWAVKYATEPNLLNVALTRARDHLIVVGDRSACLAAVGTPLRDFAAYVSRIESSLFDSPLELELFEALLQTGVHAEAGKRVAGFRLDLAVEEEGIKLNIECDGAAFHQDASRDAARDASLAMQGWEVLRFSGREISRSVDICVERIHEKIKKAR
jgi:very-short-patch-repair endonuclease